MRRSTEDRRLPRPTPLGAVLVGGLIACLVAASVTGSTFFWAVTGILVLIVAAAGLSSSPTWRTATRPVGDPLGDPVRRPSGFDEQGP